MFFQSLCQGPFGLSNIGGGAIIAGYLIYHSSLLLWRYDILSFCENTEESSVRCKVGDDVHRTEYSSNAFRKIVNVWDSHYGTRRGMIGGWCSD